MRSAVPLVLALGLTGCVLDNSAGPDARQYQDPYADASPDPWFRDGGCGPGTSGVSGGDCGDGGTTVYPDAAVPDAGIPDAEPPPDASCEEYTFEYVNGVASTVWVTGSFTAWATEPPGALEMESVGGGLWRLTTMVGAGHQTYKFVIDGTDWIADPANPNQEPDGYGNYNSVLDLCL